MTVPLARRATGRPFVWLDDGISDVGRALPLDSASTQVFRAESYGRLGAVVVSRSTALARCQRSCRGRPPRLPAGAGCPACDADGVGSVWIGVGPAWWGRYERRRGH